jgi:hypothetical protein
MIMAAELEELLGVCWTYWDLWCFSQILHNLSICFFSTYAGNPDDMTVLTNQRERWQAFVCTSDCWKRGIASAVDNIVEYKFSFSQIKMLSGVWIVALNISECLPLYFRLYFVHQKICRGLLVDMACKKLYVLVVGMLLWKRKKREEKNSNKYKGLHFKIGG